MPGILGRVRSLPLALTVVSLTLGLAGSALARARNSIHVAAPAHAAKNAVYNVAISGFSTKRDQAYLFVDYRPCAASVSAERRIAPGEEVPYTVHGAFTRVSGWKSSMSGVDHACAFLVNPKTGRTVASARVSYSVGRR